MGLAAGPGPGKTATIISVVGIAFVIAMTLIV
jgi:hypothetical protein